MKFQFHSIHFSTLTPMKYLECSKYSHMFSRKLCHLNCLKITRRRKIQSCFFFIFSRIVLSLMALRISLDTSYPHVVYLLFLCQKKKMFLSTLLLIKKKIDTVACVICSAVQFLNLKRDLRLLNGTTVIESRVEELHLGNVLHTSVYVHEIRNNFVTSQQSDHIVTRDIPSRRNNSLGALETMLPS